MTRPISATDYAQLESGLAELPLAPSLAPSLAAYLALLHRWNRVHNLTAVREIGEMIPLHVLDSLAILPHLEGKTWLDVGSGAGLPGIPLAIAQPTWQFTLIDASQKRVLFMQQAALELGLKNVRVLHQRGEAITDSFDAAICRALSGLTAFFEMTHGRATRLYAMKGQYPETELTELQQLAAFRAAPWTLAVTPIAVPQLTAQRHLVQMRRS